MKLSLVFLFFFVCIEMNGQQMFPTISKDAQSKPPEEQIQLNEAVVVSTRLFTNDTTRYRYNQMKHYIKMILPYVDAAVSMFNEIETSTNDMSKKNRRKYIRSKEKEIKVNFEDKLSSLNITQGRLLVKLINRQLENNCYSILKELKNPITAAYYQSVAKLNGINLNEDYKPEENRELEMIMRNLGYEKDLK
ncbi:MAG TPA: DUF4294 domain-containing protein [Chitinophagaceae bacterium]|nr:DUF4294 domain-containing protein [Chitinophagaceae bacterium]